jgi:hypothetical protein
MRLAGTITPDTPQPGVVVLDQTAVTPPVVAAPAPVVDTPQVTAPISDFDSMLADLAPAAPEAPAPATPAATPTLGTVVPPVAPATAPIPAAPAAPSVTADLADPSIILQRDHYLRELNRVRAAEASLAEQQAEIDRQRTALDFYARQGMPLPVQPGATVPGQPGTAAVNPPQPAPVVPPVSRFADLNPEDFVLDSERRLATAVRELADLNARQQADLLAMHNRLQAVDQTASQFQQTQQQTIANNVITMCQQASQQVEREWGIAITDIEAGQLLLTYAPAIAAGNGGTLPADAAYRAWMIHNGPGLAAQLRSAQAAQNAVAPVPAAPAPQPPSTEGARLASQPANDDERMLLDLTNKAV